MGAAWERHAMCESAFIVATGSKGKLCMEAQSRKYATILLAGLTGRTLRNSNRRVLRAGVKIIGDGAGVLGGDLL